MGGTRAQRGALSHPLERGSAGSWAQVDWLPRVCTLPTMPYSFVWVHLLAYSWAMSGRLRERCGRAYFTIFPFVPLDHVKYHPLIYLSQTHISDWKQINDTGLRSPEAGIKFCPGYQEPRASAYHARETGASSWLWSTQGVHVRAVGGGEVGDAQVLPTGGLTLPAGPHGHWLQDQGGGCQARPSARGSAVVCGSPHNAPTVPSGSLLAHCPPGYQHCLWWDGSGGHHSPAAASSSDCGAGGARIPAATAWPQRPQGQWPKARNNRAP